MIEAKSINPYQGKKTEQPEYDKRQLSKYLRRCNEIKAYNLLKVEDKKLTIPLPPVFGEGKTATFELNQRFDAERHIPGNYVDVILGYTTYQGRATSYQLTYIGITPNEFIPTNGESIG